MASDKEIVIQALNLSRDDLLVQLEDHKRYAPAEDVKAIKKEITTALKMIDKAVKIVEKRL